LSVYRDTGAAVLGIPRGGVPVGLTVAAALRSPFDIAVVRKIPIPDEPEAGYGAVTEDGDIVLNENITRYLGLTAREIESQADDVREEIARRARVLRKKLARINLKGKMVILVDDGLASGYTMLAAVESARKRKAGHVVIAVPVASGGAYEMVKPKVDDIIAIEIAYTQWFAVASFYRHWHDLTDEEVLEYIEKWRAETRK
jgi:putative phosphoribosyl transferase